MLHIILQYNRTWNLRSDWLITSWGGVSRSQGSYIHIHLFDLKVQCKTQLGKVNTSKACVHHELKASNLFSCRPKLDIRKKDFGVSFLSDEARLTIWETIQVQKTYFFCFMISLVMGEELKSNYQQNFVFSTEHMHDFERIYKDGLKCEK